MNDMPTLETARLIVRPFVMEDLDDVHRLLDVEKNPRSDPPWLQVVGILES